MLSIFCVVFDCGPKLKRWLKISSVLSGDSANKLIVSLGSFKTHDEFAYFRISYTFQQHECVRCAEYFAIIDFSM